MESAKNLGLDNTTMGPITFLGREKIVAIGIMTGNSMDGADVVATEFTSNGEIRDLAAYSAPFPDGLAASLRTFRSCFNDSSFDMKAAEAAFDVATNTPRALDKAHELYIDTCARSIKALIDANPGLSIDVVGFHGQTLGHFPPSIARTKDAEPFTVQLGNGQILADRIGIPVVFDFRSDDLIQGGEGAPLAPHHHNHLAQDTRKRGYFPIAFVNAGNTGNISIISNDRGTGQLAVIGWDTGPFNHFPDLIARRELGKDLDAGGLEGAKGSVNLDLLRILFERSAITKDGKNFLTQSPPRSSDPQWYQELPELMGTAAVGGAVLSLSDRLRTVEYFSAYIVMYSLSLLPENYALPTHYALCGGGWKNQVALEHFKALLDGNEQFSPILVEHRVAFSRVVHELKSTATTTCNDSSFYGYDGTAMEARIFADAAVSRVINQPFTSPQTTGVDAPCVCGHVCFPNVDSNNSLYADMNSHGTMEPQRKKVSFQDVRFGRAIPGWKNVAQG